MSQMRQRVVEFDLKVQNELYKIAGVYPEEVSLLTKISQLRFQCVPVYTFVEVEGTENDKMRFLTTLSLNKLEVGQGYGANKKAAKLNAARMAL